MKIIIASMDYEAFVGLMRVMRGRARSERADAKGADSAGPKSKEADGDKDYKADAKDAGKMPSDDKK